MAEKLAIISGESNLGQLSYAEAKKAGYDVMLIAVKGFTPRKLIREAEKKIVLGIDQLDLMIEQLQRNGIEQLLMIGRIPHRIVFLKRKQLKRMLNKIKPDYFSTNAFFKSLIAYIESFGIKVVNSTKFLGSLLAEERVYTPECKIDLSEQKDIEFAFNKACLLAAEDIGQTVCVMKQTVIAVEALEGTDQAIRRAAKICKQGFVVAKVARRSGDMRYDVPVVGMKTVSLLKRYRAKALLVEAGQTLIVDKEKFIAAMKKNAIYFEGRR